MLCLSGFELHSRWVPLSGDQPNLCLTYFTSLGVNTFFSLLFCVANFHSQSLMCSCGICCYCHVEI